MKAYQILYQDFKTSYMLLIPLSIIVQSCFGSIVALYILYSGSPSLLLKLALCALVCMIYNASILAQLKPRFVFNLLLISIVMNLLLLALTLNGF